MELSSISDRPSFLIQALRGSIAFASIYYIAVYLVVAIARMSYPFELEWMEGGTLVNVHRIASGEAIYVRPSPEYAPYFYTPFYYYAAAWISTVLGEGFFAPRLLSFLFSLGNLTLIFALVRSRTRSWLGGIAAAGLFSGAYRMTGLWYDLGRVDSMFLFFLLASTYLMLMRSGYRSAILAGVFVAISYFTKQTAFAVAVWIFIYELIINPRRAASFALSACVPILLGSFLLDLTHGGWFSYVTRRLMLNQRYYLPSVYTFWTSDIMLQLPVCVGMAGYGIFRAIRSGRRSEAWLILLLGAGWVGASWLSRINIGGYRNVLIPAVSYAAVIIGYYISFCSDSASDKRTILIYVISLFQLAVFQFDFPSRTWNNPLRWIPSLGDSEANEKFVTELRRIEGDVLIPNHPYLLLLAGKKLCAHTAGVDDVMRGDDGRVRGELIGEIRRRIEAGAYAAIILEREWIFRKDVENYYQFSRKIFGNDTDGWPVTGWRTRPEEVWVPSPAPSEIH